LPKIFEEIAVRGQYCGKSKRREGGMRKGREETKNRREGRDVEERRGRNQGMRGNREGMRNTRERKGGRK
jgi:hypothetical protein